MEQLNKEARILEIVFEEVNNPTWAMFEQFLTAHQIDYENGKPKVVYINMENPDVATVYLAVHEEDFYYAMWVDTKEELSLSWMGDLPKIEMYMSAESETLTVEEMMVYTNLDTQVVRRKGELRFPNAKTINTFSSIFIEPNPEPRDFEDKLLRLLNYLEQDKEGIRTLAEKSETAIVARCLYYGGHFNLGQLAIDKKLTKRIAELNMAIIINLEAWGDETVEEPEVEEVLKKLKEKALRELEERKKTHDA